MANDRNDFFKEATLAICGNLDTADSLFAAFNVLKKWMPVDHMYIETYEAEINCMRIIASASDKGGLETDMIIPLPEAAKEQTQKAQQTIKTDINDSVIIVNGPEMDPVSQFLIDSMDLPPSSIMGLPLIIDGMPFGAFILTTEGFNNYTEEHAELLLMLREPFYISLSNAIQHRNILQLKNLLMDDNRFLHRELHKNTTVDIIGADFGLKPVMDSVSQVAPLDSPVLLLGETGTGKDVIANAIHQLSPRKDKPFIAVNCGGIPDNLVDSELFGHEKGAFTGALSQKRGRFERAHLGTIFLDEIGELPLQAQVRLLRVLQDRIIERVGGSKPISLDIRIIAATNRNLEEMVTQGKFREDLWFRLNVFPIHIPPLRKRTFDIPALVQYFIQQKARELKLSSIPKIAEGSMDTLIEYNWPGNVRELQNIVERSLIINPKGPISFAQFYYPNKAKTESKQEAAFSSENLDEVTIHHINKVLTRCEGKIHGPDGAAERLGINASTLRNKMNKLGIVFGKKKK